jgi:glycerol-3-phosphate dehydrogenase
MGYTPHVLVVGGGPLGAGLARDFAVRGLDVTLATPGPLATPRAGRAGGLLASGAQFARTDPAYARRCLAENRTLFEIASHAVEDTGGLVVGADLDALAAACERCSIAARRLTGEPLDEAEPGLAAAVEAALAVPDASIDPDLLTVATARDAREYGAEVRPRTEVTEIRVANDAVDGVTLRHDPLPADLESPGYGDVLAERGTDAGEPRPDGGTDVPGTLGSEYTNAPTGGEWPEPGEEDLDVDYVVNAAGVDAPEVAALADCTVPVTPRQVTVAVTADRVVEGAVTRAGTAPDTDTAVPVGQHARLASVTGDVAADSGGIHPAPAAVDAVETGLSELVETGDLRTVRGVRMPRYDQGVDDGRDYALLDHDRQGCWGLLTVLGGTVTTHRWVAERVCDRVCGEFGIRRECQTDELLLPGSEDVPDLAKAVGTFGLSETVYEHSKRRLGSEASTVLHTDGTNPVLCPDRSVTRAEVRAALDDETSAAADLGGVRVRTAATTGACQGGRCAHRVAAQLHPAYDPEVVAGACRDLLAERWRGQRPVTGPQITAMARHYRLHAAVFARRHDHPDLGHEDLAAFDNGIEETTDRPTCCPREAGSRERLDPARPPAERTSPREGWET